MIRVFQQHEIDDIMKIWLETNIAAHDFIPSSYWESNYELVKEMMPQATLYVYELEGNVAGFVGLMDHYIAGIFIKKELQSKGVGKKLLEYCKKEFEELSLQVYQKNTRAVNFYLREGFAIVKEQRDENTNEVEYVMEWKKVV